MTGEALPLILQGARTREPGFGEHLAQGGRGPAPGAGASKVGEDIGRGVAAALALAGGAAGGSVAGGISGLGGAASALSGIRGLGALGPVGAVLGGLGGLFSLFGGKQQVHVMIDGYDSHALSQQQQLMLALTGFKGLSIDVLSSGARDVNRTLYELGRQGRTDGTLRIPPGG